MTGPATATADVRATRLAGPTWRRARLWLVLAALIAVGAIAVTALSSTPGQPLDPSSPSHSGSKALAVLLRARGTAISSTTSLSAAVAAPGASTVLVSFPDELSSAQLSQLAGSGHRLVVIDPDPSSLATIAPAYEANGSVDETPIAAGCSWPAASAIGPVQFPDPTDAYSGPSTCYQGAVVVTDSLVLLGSSELLTNERLASNDTAALDINAISADGSVAQVVWLLPGVDDAGTGRPTIWDLFPPFVSRAFWWLVVVGVLVALWRGRRLGPVVTEPLPVVVRSAEVVEGHGRLYQRAGARERAAALLRFASVARLASALGLARGASGREVAAVAATRGRDGPRVAEVLTGGVPADDRALLQLARDLTNLEADVTNREA